MREALFNILTYLEPAACAVSMVLIVRSRSTKKYLFLVLFLGVRLASTGVCLTLLRLAQGSLDRHIAYKLFFYTYWGSYAFESVLSLLIVYSIFRIAMAPLKGLQRLGTLVFRWAAAISAALSMAVTFSSHKATPDLFSVAVTQLQEVSSILTLCLLLFVCFAVRPLGLSYRDRVFGVSFGLGLLATASLVDSAWILHNPSVRSDVGLANGISTCLTLIIWSIYFGLPEIKAQIIMVPTTSPFLTWNTISEVLGDAPGYVALANVTPESFSAAEMEIMFRASAKMAELEAGTSDPISHDGGSAPHTLLT